MSDKLVAARIRANEELLRRKADEVAAVVREAYGIVGATSAQQVYNDIATSLRALDQYPDCETTHGRVCLRRHPTDPHSFQVMLNLGTIDLFVIQED